jgi:chromosome segregation ATPase
MLISHHKTDDGVADVLYGVTMETPGISKLVSVLMSDRKKSDAPLEGESPAVAVAVA